MLDDERNDEERLSRLLSSVRADADPALWTRVRARLESRSRLPSLVAWAMRPAALGISLALFAACATLSVSLMTRALDPATGSSLPQASSLADALVDEREPGSAVESALLPEDGGADSGSVR